MFDWIFDFVAGRKESLSISMTEQQQKQRRIEIEAVLNQHRRQQSSQPEAAHAWMEELHSSQPEAAEMHIPDSIEIDDEKAAIKPENRILTLQGMMFQPRNQTLPEGLEELELEAAASASMIEPEVSPPLTFDAAAMLLRKAEVQYFKLRKEYRDFHYTVGLSFNQRLKSLFDGYLRFYQSGLFFTDTEDPMEMNKELKNLLQKCNEQKALLENSLEESRKQFFAKYEEIRKLTLEAAQLERDIIQECREDDNNNKGGWLTWLYAAAATLYVFKILSSSPSVH